MYTLHHPKNTHNVRLAKINKYLISKLENAKVTPFKKINKNTPFEAKFLKYIQYLSSALFRSLMDFSLTAIASARLAAALDFSEFKAAREASSFSLVTPMFTRFCT